MSIILKQHIDEISPLTDDEFAFVVSHFTVKKFKKHQYLIQEGDLVQNDYFVVSGLLKSSHTDARGKEHILQFAMENWWISDPQAYHNQTPATLYVNCLEDTETLAITLHNREKLCAEFRKMEYFFRKKTTAGYIAMQKRVLSLIGSDSKERYLQLIEQYPQFRRLPKTMIAAYLGITRETLSRFEAS
jgi:CRP-like cAMP-binding protein